MSDSILLLGRLLLLALPLLGGCTSLANSAASRMADNLSLAILNQDDPATVEAAMPSYLLLADSMIEGDPQNESVLLAGSKLYGAYTAAFVKDAERAQRLALRTRTYADRALCAHDRKLCALYQLSFETFMERVKALRKEEVPLMFASASAWAGWIQANSGDWNAVAQLPKVKAMMVRVTEVDEAYSHGEAHLYLGVIATLLPPALGGKPEEGRRHFERAIELSKGRDLIAKVEFARRYARITYDRELHDRLLHEVLKADAAEPELTLSNMLAKRQAHELLASADSYF